MTDKTTKDTGADAESVSAIITVDSPDEQADLQENLTEIDEFPEELTDETDDDLDDIEIEEGVRSGGAVSGGFGFAGLALAVVSLTTNWTGGVVASHSQYSEEIGAPSTGLTVQQELNMYANSWHTEAWWALIFAAAAVLFGIGALLGPGLLRGTRAPGWAKAGATGAIIVGLVGVILAVLTITGVFGGHLTAPTTSAG